MSDKRQTDSPFSDAHYEALAETAKAIAAVQLELDPYYQGVSGQYAEAMREVTRALLAVRVNLPGESEE